MSETRFILILADMGKHIHTPQSDDDDSLYVPLWRSRIGITAILMVAILALSWWAFRWLSTPAPETEPFDPVALEETTAGAEPGPENVNITQTETQDQLIIHVAGEVKEPGIVYIDPGQRVVDAIQQAGGPTNQAQLDALNLAAEVHDGEQILVPSSQQDASEPGGTTDAAPSRSGADGNGKINVNLASAAELQELPGVGPAIAQRIIDHRESNGPFGSAEDLQQVSGIGPATAAKFEGLITW